jgi:hypothetical protein
LVFDSPSRLLFEQVLLLASPLNLCPAIASGLDLDRNRLVADVTL